MRFTLLLCFFVLTCTLFSQSTTPKVDSVSLPEQLAQQQLDGYNARNIEDFLAPYAEDVKIYNFPNTLTMEGKDQMRKSYNNMFIRVPKLHCELVNRIVMDDTVIDQENVSGFGDEPFKAIAIYKIKDGKIAEVYFIQ